MRMLTRMLVAIAAGLLSTVGLAPLTATAAFDRPAKDVLQFDTAFANVSPFIGAAGAIRGVTAAPLPWQVHEVHGDLDADGQLHVRVEGLVLADDPAVPANLRGTNPVPFFAAIVSCETSAGGTVVVQNVMTANFTATMPSGNAEIRQRLALPRPCAAPDVFVTSPNGQVWFAATGVGMAKPNRDVLEFQTAFANVAPFIGAAGTITGEPAAPFPWTVRALHGDLDASGQLDVDVNGLVLADDPAVPANLRNTNPVPFFAAVVTCRTNVGGAVGVVKVVSDNFPATPEGDAHIHQMLTLPRPCVTPYVFVTSPNGGFWFAVTGTP